ncbi:MAG TPA: N-acetylmuramoyl-L-alanine amidase, partial [Terriglobales bacterium]
GTNRVRIRGKDVDLAGPFLLENDRGLVPVESLVTLLPHFLGFPVTFHVGARRLFIKEEGTTYAIEFNKAGPPRLVMNFSAPVNPTIATEPGKLRMVFVRDPLLLSGAESASYNDKTIPSATFQESNGAVEIAVTGTVPLLASFSNDGRTITIAPAPSAPPPAVAQGQASPQVPGAAATPPPGTAPPPSGPMRTFAVIDPSHGGDERGAALSDTLAEKDVTLAVARRIRQELENRGLSASILRDGDTTMTLDQRASAANAAHPAIYISVHAAGEGTGVRVFTALMPSGGETRGAFVAWERAQFPFLPTSQAAAASIASELRKNLPVRALAAPLRPLNNLTEAALAIEVAPQAGEVNNLNSPDYQQLIAVSVANGLVSMRDRLGGGR